MNLLLTCLTGGLGLASLHFVWVLLVALGWAQPFMDFVFKLHMLDSPFKVQPFNIVLALGLLVITFLIGCFYGLAFHFAKTLFFAKTISMDQRAP